MQVVELPFYVIVGLLCGGTSALLAAASRSTSSAFVGLRTAGVPPHAMPVIGGLATGSLALICPEIAYQVCLRICVCVCVDRRIKCARPHCACACNVHKNVCCANQ